MSTNLLHLEDCLEDSPQTRALLGVYERDSDQLLSFSQDINTACRRVAQAQNELALATQAFTQKLRDFQESNLTGNSDEELLGSAVQQLATGIDEVSSFHTVLYSELSENMEYYSSQFLNKEMTEYLRLKSNFQASDKAHEEASMKLARVSKKNKGEKGWQEATDQLYAARKAFHNTSMLYCCCLNDLQVKKKVGILKPIVTYLRSQIGFFQMGTDLGKDGLEDRLRKLSEDLSKIERETMENRDLSVERMDRLDAESTRAYIPDPPASMDFPDLPVDVGKTQISGYLFSRSRSGLMMQWHRNYFFTQGGNLMQQSKKEFAGQLFMDLDGCTVGSADVDDRRNVFQIISAEGKHSSVLQGESKQQCQEWIATIRNISAGLYLEDNPREAIKQARQSSLSEGATTSSASESPLEMKKSSTAEEASVHASEKPRTSSMFARLKQAASSLITPEEKQTKEPSPEPATKELQPAKPPTSLTEPQTPSPSLPPVKTTPQDQTVNPPSNPAIPVENGGGDPNLSTLLDPTEPILFDLPSAIPEQHPPAQDERDPVAAPDDGDASQRRQNPFTASAADETDVGFKAMFIVRFLGCKQIHPGSDLDASIADTIWQVMTARALHKMFKMNELHLIVSDHSVRLVDPNTQLNRESFPVATVLRIKTHIDNQRLFGFVAHRSGGGKLLCYTFESNADGDDVCCAINTARVMEQSKVEHEEDRKQREIEMNLEEQSRMIIASSSALMKGEDGVEPVDDPPASGSPPTVVDGTAEEKPEVTDQPLL